MEHLNNVEIRGRVGNVTVLPTINGHNMVRMSVRTERRFGNGNGGMVVETTWHNISAADIRNIPEKGDGVEVRGRLRNQRFTDSDGVERYVSEIEAREVTVV